MTSGFRYEIRRRSGEVLDRATSYRVGMRLLSEPELTMGVRVHGWKLELWDVEAGVLVAFRRANGGGVIFSEKRTAA